MTRTALIERGKDGTYGIFTPDIGSLIIGEGKTVAEAKADFENSLREVRQFAKEDGVKLPEDLAKAQFIYKYDMASLFNYYPSINVTQFAKYIGLNPSLMRQYKTGNAYISEKQAAKIEEGIHRLGKELMEVKLIA